MAIDILYANENLVQQWVAHINHPGLPQEIIKQNRAATITAKRITAAFSILTAMLDKKHEEEKTNITHNLVSSAFIAQKIAKSKELYAYATEYFNAKRIEKTGKNIRFVLINCYLTYLQPSSDKDWKGDIVVLNPKKPFDLSHQHVIKFSFEHNVAETPRGVMARRVKTLTFWQERFRPSRNNWLSDCYAAIVWE